MPHEYVEGRRRIALHDTVAGDDGVERRASPEDVVGFDGKNFAQGVCGALAEECPRFHFPHALAAVLRLASQGLLGGERVGADGAHVYLVFHHVVEFQHVHDADGDGLCERFACASVEKHALAAFGHAGLFEFVPYLLFGGAAKRRHDSLIAEHLRREAEVQFEDLTEVHTRGHTERGQNDVHRIALFVERHVFLRQYAGDDAFVAVTARQLVADRYRAQLRDLHVHALDDAALKAVAALTRKPFDADDAGALSAVHAERCVFDVLGFFSEYRVQEPLLRRELRLAFWGHLADQNIAGAHLGADADDPVLIKIAKFEFRDIWNVVRRYFGAELRVAHDAYEFLHVYRSEASVFGEPLGNDDGIFEVRAEPRKECDTYVLSDRH